MNMSISIRTNYGKAIIKKLILDNGFKGDYDKLKVYPNLSRQGTPKRIKIRQLDNEVFTDIVAYYYDNGELKIIKEANYAGAVREESINKVFDNGVIVEKKIRGKKPPVVQIDDDLVEGEIYYSGWGFIRIIKKTPKQYKYELLNWPDNARTVEDYRNHNYEIVEKPSYDTSDNYIRLDQHGHWSLNLKTIEEYVKLINR